MFIKSSRSGYNRHGEQFARGSFLLVFSHNKFKWAEETGQHWNDFPKDLERKLYACVRHVSLNQCGHWMIGTARIAGQSITVSGSYGGDGLPKDYEKLTPAARQKLTEVPADLAEQFWNGGGHNTAGAEAPAMRQWALQTFHSNPRSLRGER